MREREIEEEPMSRKIEPVVEDNIIISKLMIPIFNKEKSLSVINEESVDSQSITEPV